MDNFTNEEIIDGVLEEFVPMAAIPRPSHHEQAISDYLKGVFENMGCQVVQDQVLNIVADLPATSGWEDHPLVIMQGHMDMVCVAEAGVQFDPLHDPIRLLREGDILTADGTSMGADDGIGIATIIFIMKHLKEHGPLRAIVTVDEETGMTGAREIDPIYLADAKYLINCDSEEWDLLTVGCAGSRRVHFQDEFSREKYEGQLFAITISGLQGGHSGSEINSGVANALKTAAMVLQQFQANGISFRLISLDGGSASNVIPGSAEVLIASKCSLEQADGILKQCKKHFDSIYGAVEDTAVFSIKVLDGCKYHGAIPQQVATNLIDLLLLLPSGVLEMSQALPGLVQTSANIGVSTTDDHHVRIVWLPRSSLDSQVMAAGIKAQALGRLTGFSVEMGNIDPAWPVKAGSHLAEIMAKVFARQNDQPMKVAAIHAGIECGWHMKHNPQLDMVSIGTNNFDIHSPKEHLELWTVPPQVRLIVETLRCL